MRGQGGEWIGGLENGKPPEAGVANSNNNIYMMRESELSIKYDTEIAHSSREDYVREERGEPENVNLCKLIAATEPDGLSL